MKIQKLIYGILCNLILISSLLAQEAVREEEYLLTPLSSREEAMLQSLPELKLPPGYQNRDLPAIVDNSTQIYMRPAFQQAGLSCGQASCIAYNFTYEMARERDLNASQVQNQYPTHFAWNFMNGGEGWYGVSYLHSIQILKEYGMPNVPDYGGTLSYGGGSRWMSGYPQYYNGMHNRITNAYQIQGGTPEGLEVIKHWLHSHLEDSPVGGIASFYAQHMSATNQLPAGTPEAGKYVLTSFGGSPNHAMTIVGYNDSIRWDYNSDGQYTNHIDINGDNTVNMKDWEIGGFKMVQSYGGVPNWGDQGYAYMMYKTIADNLGSGGIWNHCVHVLDVKESYSPLLTAKIILRHTERRMIKVLAGIANNPLQYEPEVTLGFPIYDYQGGTRYMQGGTTEADQTIEFGLDLSKLLSYINMNQEVKIFLQIVEDDPNSYQAGEIIQYSIFDHTAGGIQVICPQMNVPVANDDTTTLFISRNFNFNRVNILDESLPPAPEGEYFSYQMNAAGGTPPYTWEFDKTYGESHQPAAFPAVSATQLSPSNSSSGFATQQIPFSFPFYDSVYSTITVHVDGYLMFDQQLYPFPYYQDDKVLFQITRHISPFLNMHQEVGSSFGGGLWYEGDAQSATFRWKTRLTEDPSKILNYAVKLFPDGTIKFYYGAMDGLDQFLWMAGIGDGDNYNYQETQGSNLPVITPNTSVMLTPYAYPPEMALSDNGLFFGTPQQNYGNEQITFKITDNNFIHSKKTLTFSSTGVIVNDSVISGGDPVIAFGETALMSISVLNVRPDTLFDAQLAIYIDDPYITLTDSLEALGTIYPTELRSYLNAFQFQVSTEIPDGHLIHIESILTSGAETYETHHYHYAFAPLISAEEVVVNDENHRLDAGDMTDISVLVQNAGGIEAGNLSVLLTEDDPYITINQALGMIPILMPGMSQNVVFNLSVAENCPPGHTVDFTVQFEGNGGYSATDNFSLVVGLYLENYETGDFTLFNWGHGGSRNWTIDNSGAFEGSFCARSGIITHNEESVLKIDMNVLTDGTIGFYQRTSCESDTANTSYDYLSFRIDGNELARWDSVTNWSYAEFPVEAGFRRFEWVYHKDQSTSFRFDAAWIDEITFPSAINCSPVLSASPSSLDFVMQPVDDETVSIVLSNSATGDLTYTAEISALFPVAPAGNPGSRNIEGSYLVCNAEKFHTGVEYLWNLRTYNAGNDNEWIKQVYVTFPAGFELVATTDFVGGSGGPMVYDGPFGNGVIGHWFGEDANGWGVVHMGESAACDVSVIPQLSLMQNVSIDFEVKGEVYGGTPHDVFGTIPMRNLGPVLTWLSLNSSGGTMPGYSSDSLLLTIHPAGLADGSYLAWIILNDNFGHETVIPVTLLIDTFLGNNAGEDRNHDWTINASPNPFREQVTFRIDGATSNEFHLEIFNALGHSVYRKSVNSAGGSMQMEWDPEGPDAKMIPGGIYFARISSGESHRILRIVKL